MYLDNAASTQISPQVIEKLKSVLSIYGNPSSQHEEGFKAKSIINEASEIISNKINCKSNELYYTSGATMSNNLIIQGFLRKNPNGKIIYSEIEHNDIIMMAENYQPNSFIPISVDKYGNIDIYHLEVILALNVNVPLLVTIQGANSEVGTVQKIEQISKIVHKYPDTYFHSDMTQYIPYYECDVKKLGLDALSMSGQKINCIKGIGLMYVSDKMPISSVIYGEQGLVGGTENVLGIACLGEAFDQLDYDNTDLIQKRNYFIQKLNCPLVGNPVLRTPNNICVLMNTESSENLVELFNEFDIYVSAGSACSSGSLKPSHVLLAMGYSEEDANRQIRITLNKNISYSDIDETVSMMKNLIRN